MSKPRIGLSMLYRLGETFEKMAGQIPKSPTTYVELVDDGFHTLDKNRIQTLNHIKLSYEKKYTVHAPFVGVNIALPSGSLLGASMRRLRKSIVDTSALGSDTWVFHPGMTTATNMFYPGMDWTQNLENIRLLVRFARDHGVAACVENIMQGCVLKNVEEFRKFYSDIDENVGLVLDIGHANVVGQLEGFLSEFSGRVVHVHAHDNHGKSDEHLGVGYGNINWNIIAEHLKRASFDRIVMIESIEHIEESVEKLRLLFS